MIQAQPLLDASQIAANQAAIAAHIANTSIHYADAPADSFDYVRNNNAWIQANYATFGEYVGTFDASVGTFPAALHQGDWFNTTVAGTVDGQAFAVGDILIATVDAPSTTTFAGNWSIVPNVSVTDHTLLTNIGVNTHAQIDTHLADASIHFADAPSDGNTYGRNNGAWALATADHGSLTGLGDDDHSQYALLAGRAGGQTLIGGTLASQDLTLRGSSNANLGTLQMQSPIRVDMNPAVATSQRVMRWDTSFSSGVFNGGMFESSGTVTVTGATFIWALLAELRTYQQNVAVGFAAFTLFNALPTIQTATQSTMLNALVLNIGVVHSRTAAGTSTAANMTGLNFAPQTRATVSGAVMTKTDQIAVNVQPTWSTQLGATANLGNICGMRVLNPIVALFQPGSGVETMVSLIGLDFRNISFGGNVLKAAVRSQQNAGSNAYVIRGEGTAQSELNGNLYFRTDLIGTVYGASDDLTQAWAAGNFMFWQFNASGDQLRWSNPSVNRYVLQTENGDADGELNMGFERYSFGQIGSVGNQVGVFVAPTRTVSVAGGWADFLLTQAGNITVNAAMSQLFGWTINAPSITLGTGSVTDAGGLLLGGNVSQGTNRYGLLVLSSPSGGTLNYCARFQGAAGVLVDGLFEHAGSTLGFYGATPITVPTVTGSRGGNAALADLLTDLANLGLIVDGTIA